MDTMDASVVWQAMPTIIGIIIGWMIANIYAGIMLKKRIDKIEDDIIMLGYRLEKAEERLRLFSVMFEDILEAYEKRGEGEV